MPLTGSRVGRASIRTHRGAALGLVHVGQPVSRVWARQAVGRPRWDQDVPQSPACRHRSHPTKPASRPVVALLACSCYAASAASAWRNDAAEQRDDGSWSLGRARVAQRLVDLAALPECEQQHGQSSCDRNQGALLRIAGPRLRVAQPPPAEVAIGAERAEDVVGRLDQHPPQRHVPRLCDPQLGCRSPESRLRGASPRKAPISRVFGKRFGSSMVRKAHSA